MARSLGAVLLLLFALSGCSAANPSAIEGPATADGAPPSTAPDAASPPSADSDNGTRPLVELTSHFVGLYPALMTYEPARLEAAAGSRVRVTFENQDHNPLGKHNWRIKGFGNETRLLAVGESDTLEFEAPPVGSYLYICSVPQHEGFGMKGDFAVV